MLNKVCPWRQVKEPEITKTVVDAPEEWVTH